MSQISSIYHALRNKGRARGYRGRPSLFQSLNGYAGVDLLPRDLTINGTTVAPSFWYNVGDASAAGLNPEVGGAAGNMTLQAGTAPTYNHGSPLGQQGDAGTNSPNDDSTLFNSGGYFTPAGAAFGDITTEDFVFRLRLRFQDPVGAAQRVVEKYSGADGYVFYTTGLSLRLIVKSGATTVDVLLGTLAAGAWYDVMVFGRRLGSLGAYINALATSTPLSIAAVGSMTTAAKLNISAATIPFSGAISQFAMWKSAAWLDTHLQAGVAATCFRQVRGLLAQRFRGDDEPIVDARTTAAYVQRVESGGERKLYFVGADWAVPHEHPPGQTRAMIRIEPEETALDCFSEALNSWTQLVGGTTTVSVDDAEAPNRATTGDSLIEAASNDLHIRYRTGLHTASINDITNRAEWVKNGDRRYAIVGIINTSEVNTRSYVIIDTTDGSVTASVTTNGAKIAAPTNVSVKPYGDGWYRVKLSALHVVAGQIGPTRGISSDGTIISFLGVPGSFPLGIRFWGAMVTKGTVAAPCGSYIPTTTGDVIRTADSLRLEGLKNLGLDGNARRGRFSCDIWLPNAVLGTDRVAFSLNDGGVINDRIEVRVKAADGKAALQIQSTEGGLEVDIAGSTVLNVGAINRLEVVYGLGRASLLVNGVSEATATPGDIPDGLDRIQIGADYTGVCLGAVHIADLDARSF